MWVEQEYKTPLQDRILSWAAEFFWWSLSHTPRNCASYRWPCESREVCSYQEPIGWLSTGWLQIRQSSTGGPSIHIWLGNSFSHVDSSVLGIYPFFQHPGCDKELDLRLLMWREAKQLFADLSRLSQSLILLNINLDEILNRVSQDNDNDFSHIWLKAFVLMYSWRDLIPPFLCSLYWMMRNSTQWGSISGGIIFSRPLKMSV